MKLYIWTFVFIKKVSIILFTMGLIFSCASHKDYIFEEEDDQQDPVSLFDLTDSRFERFRSSDDELSSLDSDEKEGDQSEKDKEVIKTKDETEVVGPKDSDYQEEADKEVAESESIEEDKKEEDKEEDKVEEEDEYPEEFYEYDERSKKVWSLFEPNSYTNERFVFRISYLGLTAGTVQLTTEPMTEIGGRDVFHFRAHLRSARYYRFIYELDDRLETYVDAQNFLPVKYSLIQRESGQDVDDLQLFDSENRESHLFFKRVREDRVSEREETHPIPYYIQDSFSSLYFVRGLPLEVGDRYEFPVVTRGKIWLIELDVAKKEEVRIDGQWVEAIRVNAVTRFPGVLEREGDIIFWYSADEVKRPLKFRADVKIGSIRGEVVEYTPGTRAQVVPEENSSDE